MCTVEGNDVKTDLPSNFLLPPDHRKPEFVGIHYILGRLSFIEIFLKTTKYVKLPRLGPQYNFTVKS